MAGLLEIGTGLAVRVSDRAALGSRTSVVGSDRVGADTKLRWRSVASSDFKVKAAIGAANGALNTQEMLNSSVKSDGYKMEDAKAASNGRRKTKIVCTIGPSTNTREMIWKLAEVGMNVARLNMSHGDHASHQIVIDLVKEYNAQAKDNVIAIMLDTKGPEVRSGDLAQPIWLNEGQTFNFTIKRGVSTEDTVSVNYDDFINDVESGDVLLVDGGMMSLVVRSKTSDTVKCEVVDGGELKSRRHLNVRGKSATLPLKGIFFSKSELFEPPQISATPLLFKELTFKKKMPFKRYVEIGRVALVNYGKDYGRLVVIVDVVDHNRALVDAPDMVRGQMNFKRLSLTDFKIDIPRCPKKKILIEAMEKADVKNKWEKSSWGRKLIVQKRRAELTDFDRFKVMLAKIKRGTVIRQELNKLKNVSA